MAAADPSKTRAAVRSLLAWWEAAGVDAAPSAPSPRAADGAGARAERRAAPRADPQRSSRSPARPAPSPQRAVQAIEEDARALAARCDSLEALKAALEAFDHPLKAAARNTVFARGAADAPVMIVGEAPGREEDREGLPFVGRSGQLMDRMFAAIGLDASAGLYITNVINWRPPQNRSPSEAEILLTRAFTERHVALKKPKILVFAGAVAAQTLLGVAQGITRIRGRWFDYKVKGPDGQPTGETIPAMPIYHPAYVLRRPISKREVWRDLLAIQEKLEEL